MYAIEGGQRLAAAELRCAMLAAALQVQLLPVSKVAVRDLGQDWLTIYQGAGLSTNWSALRAGCKYQLRVAARNSVGFSQFSIPVSFMTQPDAPLAPAKPTALCESRVSGMHGVAVECSGLGVVLHKAAIHKLRRMSIVPEQPGRHCCSAQHPPVAQPFLSAVM